MSDVLPCVATTPPRADLEKEMDRQMAAKRAKLEQDMEEERQKLRADADERQRKLDEELEEIKKRTVRLEEENGL